MKNLNVGSLYLRFLAWTYILSMEWYWSPLLACYASSHFETTENCSIARKQPSGYIRRICSLLFITVMFSKPNYSMLALFLN